MKRKIKSKYGVFKGTNISDDILSSEKSLNIQELSNSNFTIEKNSDITEQERENVVIIDHQQILNKKIKPKISVYIKWCSVFAIFLFLFAAIIFLVIKVA